MSDEFAARVRQLQAERLRPVPPPPRRSIQEPFRQVIHLLAEMIEDARKDKLMAETLTCECCGTEIASGTLCAACAKLCH